MFRAKQTEMLSSGLDPKAVSKRSSGYGKNSKKLSYLEGQYVIERMNEIFGFDGWSTNTIENRCIGVEHYETEDTYNGGTKKMVRVGFRARVRLTVFAGERVVVREAWGFGNAQNSEKVGVIAAQELALKEAETDALKRAARQFGNQFGNSLYDSDNPVHKGGEDSHGHKMVKEKSVDTFVPDASNPFTFTKVMLAIREAKTKEDLEKVGDLIREVASLENGQTEQVRLAFKTRRQELS